MKRLLVLLTSLAVLATACSQGNVFSLAVGDCFNDPDSASQISSVEIVDCGTSHDNEVYATFDIAGDSFPGQSAIQSQASDGCLDRFEPYVGAAYIDSILDVSFLTPSEESWDRADDREVVCFLYDLSGAPLMTSAQGTGV